MNYGDPHQPKKEEAGIPCLLGLLSTVVLSVLLGAIGFALKIMLTHG